MDELQNELMAAQEVTDAIHKGINMDHAHDGGLTEEDDLIRELNLLLMDEGETQIELVQSPRLLEDNSILLPSASVAMDKGLTLRRTTPASEEQVAQAMATG